MYNMNYTYYCLNRYIRLQTTLQSSVSDICKYYCTYVSHTSLIFKNYGSIVGFVSLSQKFTYGISFRVSLLILMDTTKRQETKFRTRKCNRSN
jgi:hypothetical protein